MAERQRFEILGTTYIGWAPIAGKLKAIRDSGKVTDDDQAFIDQALLQCSRADEFEGYVRIIVQKNPSGQNYELAAVFADGREPKTFSPKHLNLSEKTLSTKHLDQAMRRAIERQTTAKRLGSKNEVDGVSEVSFEVADAVTGKIIRGPVEVDHEIPFVRLQREWMAQEELTEATIVLKKAGTEWEMADEKQRRSWQKYHAKNAQMRALSSDTHRAISDEQTTQRAEEQRRRRGLTDLTGGDE